MTKNKVNVWHKDGITRDDTYKVYINGKLANTGGEYQHIVIDGTTCGIYPTLTKKERDFVLFHNDRNNWRPPTNKRCAEALGYKDVKSIHQYKKQTKEYLDITNHD